jgi:hypothetical protein
MALREERYEVDFPVFLSWQVGNAVQRVTARCVNLSPSGAKLETRDRLQPRTNVLVHSEQFGRMGTASIRYCTRQAMKYEVGLQFATPFARGDPVRRKILDGLLEHKNQHKIEDAGGKAEAMPR